MNMRKQIISEFSLVPLITFFLAVAFWSGFIYFETKANASKIDDLTDRHEKFQLILYKEMSSLNKRLSKMEGQLDIIIENQNRR